MNNREIIELMMSEFHEIIDFTNCEKIPLGWPEIDHIYEVIGKAQKFLDNTEGITIRPDF